MSHWTLEDRTGYKYTFPEFVLQAGAVVNIWTGKGVDTSTDLYWDHGQSVWNNDEPDTATLRSSRGEIVTTFSYEP